MGLAGIEGRGVARAKEAPQPSPAYGCSASRCRWKRTNVSRETFCTTGVLALREKREMEVAVCIAAADKRCLHCVRGGIARGAKRR